MMPEPLVSLRGVWKIYRLGRGVEVAALRGVDLDVLPGDSLAVMGPSGSGKSTLLHILGCLDTPTRGRALFRGRDINGMSADELARFRRTEVGFVFQEFNLSPSLTALENVELPMVFAGVPRGTRRRRALELLEAVGLGDRAHHRPGELSGGERQRVAIARALANSPWLTLADEPTGNLDSNTGRAILSLLEDLNRDGRALVLVTHDPEAAGIAARVLRMRDGRFADAVA